MSDEERDEQIRQLTSAVAHLYDWLSETYVLVNALQSLLRENGVIVHQDFLDRCAGVQEIGRHGTQASGAPPPPEWLRALLQKRGSTEQ